MYKFQILYKFEHFENSSHSTNSDFEGFHWQKSKDFMKFPLTFPNENPSFLTQLWKLPVQGMGGRIYGGRGGGGWMDGKIFWTLRKVFELLRYAVASAGIIVPQVCSKGFDIVYRRREAPSSATKRRHPTRDCGY